MPSLSGICHVEVGRSFSLFSSISSFLFVETLTRSKRESDILIFLPLLLSEGKREGGREGEGLVFM